MRSAHLGLMELVMRWPCLARALPVATAQLSSSSMPPASFATKL
jgi:hypothetical protein